MKAKQGNKAHWPELEDSLEAWVLEQRSSGCRVSTIQTRLKGKVLAKEMNIEEFLGGPSWCSRFMRRKNLTLRSWTTVCQKLEAFCHFMTRQIDRYSVAANHIVNMDEVPLTFDIPMAKTVDLRGMNSVTIKTTGHEKTHFTCTLAVTAS